jgi:hypothetical protein
MSIDWGRLVEQGRAFGINKPWSDEELKALNVYKIPADLVRKGVLTPEEHTEELEPIADEPKMLRSMTKDDLNKLALDLGVNVPEGTHRIKIISLIKQSRLPNATKA